jgi:hypothetical protein
MLLAQSSIGIASVANNLSDPKKYEGSEYEGFPRGSDHWKMPETDY